MRWTNLQMSPSCRRNRILLGSEARHLHINRIYGLVELGWDIRIHQAQLGAAVGLLETHGKVII